MEIRVSRGFISGPCTCNEVFKSWFEIPLDYSNCCLMSSGQPLFAIHSEAEGVEIVGLTIFVD